MSKCARTHCFHPSLRMLLLLTVVGSSGMAWSQGTMTQGLVLDGVTVVNTHTGALTRDQAVVMDGGKIVRIAKAHTVKVSGSATLVNATGKFVVPGYLDMHVHPLDSNDLQGDLTLMLAKGITGFRVMSGSPEFLAQRKRGELIPATGAPELLWMPGTFLTTANAPTAAATIEQVRQQKAEGADFIKVVDMTPETLFAALDEGKAQGITVDGHLPQTVDPREAAKRGMRGIEHLGPGISVLLSCSTDEAEIRKIIAAIPPRPTQIGTVGGTPRPPDAQATKLMQRVIDTYSEPKCLALAKDVR